LLSLVGVAPALIGGYFLVMKLINMSRLEDCLLARGKNCIPIELPRESGGGGRRQREGENAWRAARALGGDEGERLTSTPPRPTATTGCDMTGVSRDMTGVSQVILRALRPERVLLDLHEPQVGFSQSRDQALI
jgi:hypothetical protein